MSSSAVVSGCRFTGTLPYKTGLFVEVQTQFWKDVSGVLQGSLECHVNHSHYFDLSFEGDKAELALSISTVTVKISPYGELDMAFDTGDMTLYVCVRTDILGRKKAHLEEIPRGLWVCFPEGHQCLDMVSPLMTD